MIKNLAEADVNAKVHGVTDAEILAEDVTVKVHGDAFAKDYAGADVNDKAHGNVFTTKDCAEA